MRSKQDSKDTKWSRQVQVYLFDKPPYSKLDYKSAMIQL